MSTMVSTGGRKRTVDEVGKGKGNFPKPDKVTYYLRPDVKYQFSVFDYGSNPSYLFLRTKLYLKYFAWGDSSSSLLDTQNNNRKIACLVHYQFYETIRLTFLVIPLPSQNKSENLACYLEEVMMPRKSREDMINIRFPTLWERAKLFEEWRIRVCADDATKMEDDVAKMRVDEAKVRKMDRSFLAQVGSSILQAQYTLCRFMKHPLFYKGFYDPQNDCYGYIMPLLVPLPFSGETYVEVKVFEYDDAGIAAAAAAEAAAAAAAGAAPVVVPAAAGQDGIMIVADGGGGGSGEESLFAAPQRRGDVHYLVSLSDAYKGVLNFDAKARGDKFEPFENRYSSVFDEVFYRMCGELSAANAAGALGADLRAEKDFEAMNWQYKATTVENYLTNFMAMVGTNRMITTNSVNSDIFTQSYVCPPWVSVYDTLMNPSWRVDQKSVIDFQKTLPMQSLRFGILFLQEIPEAPGARKEREEEEEEEEEDDEYDDDGGGGSSSRSRKKARGSVEENEEKKRKNAVLPCKEIYAPFKVMEFVKRSIVAFLPLKQLRNRELHRLQVRIAAYAAQFALDRFSLHTNLQGARNIDWYSKMKKIDGYNLCVRFMHCCHQKQMQLDVVARHHQKHALREEEEKEREAVAHFRKEMEATLRAQIDKLLIFFRGSVKNDNRKAMKAAAASSSSVQATKDSDNSSEEQGIRTECFIRNAQNNFADLFLFFGHQRVEGAVSPPVLRNVRILTIGKRFKKEESFSVDSALFSKIPEEKKVDHDILRPRIEEEDEQLKQMNKAVLDLCSLGEEDASREKEAAMSFLEGQQQQQPSQADSEEVASAAASLASIRMPPPPPRPAASAAGASGGAADDAADVFRNFMGDSDDD